MTESNQKDPVCGMAVKPGAPGIVASLALVAAGCNTTEGVGEDTSAIDDANDGRTASVAESRESRPRALARKRGPIPHPTPSS